MAPRTPVAPSEAPRALGDILDTVCEASKRFLYMEDGDRTLFTIWSAYTYVWDLFDHAPILGLYSPVPGCGKTDALRFLTCIVQKGRHELSPTPATLFREIDLVHPTLLLDEMDKADWSNGDLRSIINGGFTRGIRVPRCSGGNGTEYKVEHFDPFGPKALATLATHLPPDTFDRTNMIRLRKKPPYHKLEGLRLLRHEAGLRELGKELGDCLTHHREAIIEAEPVLPPAVVDRGADRWRPLFIVAELAGPAWLARVREAAVAHEAGKGTGDAKITLLDHILELKPDWPAGEPVTADALCAALNAREDWPYGAWDKPLTAARLGQLLKPVEVKSEKMWDAQEKKQRRVFMWATIKDKRQVWGPRGDT